jgi:hypothetical protein
MGTLTVKINEIELEVTGEDLPYRAATREEPEEGGYFEVNEIFYKGVEISALIEEIDGNFVTKIEQQINK